jgi:hypothetical protein
MPAELALVAAPTPLWRVERAEPALRFSRVALGDSFQSGEGAYDYEPGTEIEAYQRDAIVVAVQHGVRQAMMTTLAGVTPQRISQIMAETPLPKEFVQALNQHWHQDLEWPQDHLTRVSKVTTTVERDLWNQRYELIHGRPGNLGFKVPDNNP